MSERAWRVLLAPSILLIPLLMSCGGSADRASLVPIGAGLRGPAGLAATTYAIGAVHASALAFDDHGGLWIATAAYDDTGTDAVLLASRPGEIAHPVITSLHTPLGLLWQGTTLYVAAKGGVEAYVGFDGTSFASRTTVLAVAADVGEVNGLARAPDGRLLVGISAPCDHCVPASPSSAAIVGFRPDGSDNRVYASGLRAAIALTFYPGTADLFVTLNHRDDLGDKTPGDWLVLVSEGEKWGFPECWGQKTEPCTQLPQPVAVLDQHAAVSGVAIVTDELGPKLAHSAIVAEWAKGKVERVALTKDASGYHGTATPFLRGMLNPMPVTLARTGSVVVGDWSTGTIYAVDVVAKS